MKKLLVTVALGAAMVATTALAQEQRRPRDEGPDPQQAQQRADRLFQMLDANQDGSVTKAEADAALAQFEATRGDNDHRGGRMQQMIDDAFATTQAISLQQFEAQAWPASTRRTSTMTARSAPPSGSRRARERKGQNARAGRPGALRVAKRRTSNKDAQTVA